jgi:hypothetical protein
MTDRQKRYLVNCAVGGVGVDVELFDWIGQDEEGV